MGSVDRVGQELDSRYRLVARALDRGAGACWEAVDTRRDNAPVTVKFLRAVEGAALPPSLLAAIRARKVFRHDAVPTVLAHGLDGRTPWIVFDALQGDSLGTQLEASWAQGQALELSHLRAVIAAVRDALRAAHTAPLPLFAGTMAPGAVLLRAQGHTRTRGRVARSGFVVVARPARRCLGPQCTVAGVSRTRARRRAGAGTNRCVRARGMDDRAPGHASRRGRPAGERHRRPTSRRRPDERVVGARGRHGSVSRRTFRRRWGVWHGLGHCVEQPGARRPVPPRSCSPSPSGFGRARLAPRDHRPVVAAPSVFARGGVDACARARPATPHLSLPALPAPPPPALSRSSRGVADPRALGAAGAGAPARR